MNGTQRGCIKISRELYKRRWEWVVPIFKSFRPFHIEFDHKNNEWLFYGTSEHFDELDEVMPPPVYDAEIDESTEEVKFYKV